VLLAFQLAVNLKGGLADQKQAATERIKLRPLIGSDRTVNNGVVSFTTQAILRSNKTRVKNAPSKPSCRRFGLLLGRSFDARIEMKMMGRCRGQSRAR